MKFAISAICMPEYPVDFVAQKVKEWGYEAVEWRVCEITDEMERKPISYWGKNKASIDFRDFEKNAEKTRELCEKNSLKVCNINLDFIYPDLEKIKIVLQGAKIMGAPLARFETARYDPSRTYKELYAETVEYLEKVVKAAQDFGVRPVIENHQGGVCASPSMLMEVVSNFKPEELGVIFDPGNMIYEGLLNWRAALDMIGDYLAHVHVKNTGWKEVNTTADGNVEWQNVAASLLSGIINWREMVTLLKERGYDGWLAVEDLSQLRTTEKKLQDDLKFLKAITQ